MKTVHIFNEKTKKILATISLTGLLTVGATGCEVAALSFDDYSTKTQVDRIAEELGYEMDHLMNFNKGYPRFIHKDGPIYVTVSDALKPYSSDIDNALGEIFSIIHDFNDKYSYKIVDRKEIPLGASIIHIKDKNLIEEFTNACVDNFISPLPPDMMESTYIQEADILVDLEELNTSPMTMYSLVLHELGHVFGLGDVYNAGIYKTTDSYLANTMMQVYLGYKVPMFTPYDVARFAALYTIKSENKQDLNDKIEYAKTYLDDYTDKYYDFYTTSIKNCVKKASGIDMKFNDMNENEDFVFNTSVSINGDNITYGYEYEVSYSDNQYCLKIFNEKGHLLDECSGDVIIDNGVMVLQNVSLREGLRPDDKILHTPEGYIQDLTIFGWADSVHMYDATDNNIMYGTVNYVEKEASLNC